MAYIHISARQRTRKITEIPLGLDKRHASPESKTVLLEVFLRRILQTGVLECEDIKAIEHALYLTEIKTRERSRITKRPEYDT